MLFRRKRPVTELFEPLHVKIDRLVNELKKNNQIELRSPDDRTEWMIKLEKVNRILVYWRATSDGSDNYWRELNRGWRVNSMPLPNDVIARIIIGQIMVGERDTGKRLENLHCGKVMADAKIPAAAALTY